MQDQHSDTPGTFIVDPGAGIRIPEQDWAIYQADKPAYLKDPAAAREAFEKAQPKTKSKKSEVTDA